MREIFNFNGYKFKLRIHFRLTSAIWRYVFYFSNIYKTNVRLMKIFCFQKNSDLWKTTGVLWRKQRRIQGLCTYAFLLLKGSSPRFTFGAEKKLKRKIRERREKIIALNISTTKDKIPHLHFKMDCPECDFSTPFAVNLHVHRLCLHTLNYTDSEDYVKFHSNTDMNSIIYHCPQCQLAFCDGNHPDIGPPTLNLGRSRFQRHCEEAHSLIIWARKTEEHRRPILKVWAMMSEYLLLL